MNIFSLLASFTTLSSIILGVHTLRQDFRSGAHQRFFALCLAMAFWALGAAFCFSARREQDFRFWFIFGTVANLFLYPLTVQFCLFQTNLLNKKWRSIIVPILYMPLIFLGYRLYTANTLFSGFARIDGYWRFYQAYNGFWYYLTTAYFLFCGLISVVSLLIWYKTAKTNKEKRQALTIVISMIIAAFLAIIDEKLLPGLTSYQSRGIAPILYSIWIGGIWFAVTKYKFLMTLPSHAVYEIAGAIDHFVVFLNNELKIIWGNPSWYLVFGDSKNHTPYFFDLTEESSVISNLLAQKEHSAVWTVSCRFHARSIQKGRVFIDGTFRPVRDTYEDRIGLLFIGRLVEKPEDFKKQYGITHKETQIINLIVQGFTGKEIANILRLSQWTIGDHVKAIHRKLKVKNKVELLNLLKKHGQFSQQAAEESVTAI